VARPVSNAMSFGGPAFVDQGQSRGGGFAEEWGARVECRSHCPPSQHRIPPAAFWTGPARRHPEPWSGRPAPQRQIIVCETEKRTCAGRLGSALGAPRRGGGPHPSCVTEAGRPSMYLQKKMPAPSQQPAPNRRWLVFFLSRPKLSWRALLTVRYSYGEYGDLSGSRVRAARCYNDPTNDCGSGSDT
jgi:hypothetical protein